jgi:hypothetical protein
MKTPPLKNIADELSKHGRYGDTMLVHMNPREVEGIASLVPGGKLTINPVTGQPEAFLPFLVPIIGSMLGSAAAGAGMLGGLGTLAGSAIGSGLATTLATGDLEQGLISGITGFGLGSAMQGLGAAASGAGAVPGNLDMNAAKDLVNTALSETPTGIAQGITPTGVPQAVGAGGVNQQIAQAIGQTNPAPQMSPVDVTAQANPFANIVEKPNFQMSSLSEPPIQSQGITSLNNAPPKPTFTEGLMAPIREPSQFLKNMTKPEAFLPMYIGEGTNAGIRAQKAMEESGLNFKREQEKEGSMAREGILRALERVRTDYGMFAGGQVDYAEGGSIESIIKKAASKDVQPDYGAYVNELYGKYGSPSGIQSSLRGTVVNTPPAFDYNALYSGGSGYAPGVAPEFMFFGQKAPSTGGGDTGGGGTGGGTSPGAGGGDATSGGGTDLNVADIVGGIGTGPTGGAFSGGNFNGPINAGGYFGTSPSVQPADGGGGLSGQIGQPYDYFNAQPNSNTTSGSDIGSIVPGGSSFDNPYRTSDPFAKTDIQAFIDALSPSEDEYWREELAKMPDRQFAEGGMVDSVDPSVEATVNPFQGEYDNLVQSTISAIRGEIENPEPIINQFVQEYGNDAFMQLREQVLQGVQPGAQTQGLVDGPGGGMDDMVQGSISDGRPVAVSPGEYIIPADVVSAAGDGNTGGGAQFFDDLIESIRVSKNGTPEQPKPMKELMG